MSRFTWLALCTLTLLAYTASAQHDDHAHMMGSEKVPAFNATGDEPMSYALYPDQKTYFYLHVAMMVIAFWILMPIGVMFGIARSSLHVPVQMASFGFAMAGFFFGKIYGHSTPHLYAGNSHHSLGWVLFLFLIAQMAVGVVRKIANAVARSQSTYDRLETVHLVHQRQSSSSSTSSDRHSEASGETLHNHEFDFDKPAHSQSPEEYEDDELEQELSQMEPEKPNFTMRMFNAASPYIPKIVKNAFVTLAYNSFTKTVCRHYHQIMGRTFVILIFVQTLSGLVVYHGVCRSWDLPGCIAHLIKGGIFFFYGIITFGRYFGAFANRGWAWNRIDGGSRFSFEMIECGLIFTYGITNTWLEHIGQDPEWTHKDFEHASLAFMWWWCGLIGILVESRALRRLLERTILDTPLDTPRHEAQQTYSLNPFPALTVLLTGISMGNHHQETQYSTNVHFMWGLLLSLAAMCRFVTYLSLYKNTPKDNQPSRPPSELIGAFLLIAGSILFMASNAGTMMWLRRNNIDSMFMMNVCVALTSITLCYVAMLQILKAWSEKRETKKKQQFSHS